TAAQQAKRRSHPGARPCISRITSAPPRPTKSSRVKLIIHIGMPKTGSTALQRSLRLLHPALLKQGILYPRLRGMGINHNTLWLLTRSQSIPSRYFRHLLASNPQYVSGVLPRAWADLINQIERYRPQTLILSGELLFDGAAHD